MKSLPKFTLALIAAVTACCSVFLAPLAGFQEPASRGQGPRISNPEPNSAGSNSVKEQPSDAPGPESLEAKQVWDQARQRLRSYQSIRAKLTETVSVGSRRFTVSGSYLQGRGSDFKLRLEYLVKIGSTEGAVLEVCDGQVLWTRHQIGGETRISRRDVRQILQAAAESGLPDNLVTVELGFGGLPGLFASIEKSMQFDQFKEDRLDGRKLTVVEAGWKPDMLKQWQGGQAKGRLPDYVPSRVRITLDGASLFPRRILYLNRNAEGLLRPMVALDFTDVETDISIPAEKFKFVPPDGVFPEDLTQQFLDQIKQRRQAQRPAE